MADNLETIENSVAPLGAYVEQLGGGLTGWRVNLPNGEYALITYYDGDHDGDPSDDQWIAGRYDADGKDQEYLEAVVLQDAVAKVASWRG